MMQFEVIDGHVSIYEMLTQHGFAKPGQVWKQLLKDHQPQLPLFTMKQFTMRDGRKGRLTPALPLEQQAEFVRLLQMWFPPENKHSGPEKALLTLLEEAFPDLRPQKWVEVQGQFLHLFFAVPQVGVVMHSSLSESTVALQHLQGVQVVVFDPNAADFSVGQAIFHLRTVVKDLCPSSNPQL